MRTAAAAVLLVALTACGSPSPAQQLADLTGEVTRQANAEDAAGLREAARALADEVSAQRAAGELDPDRATRLLELASALRDRADRVDPAVRAREAARARAEAEAREQAARAAAERAQRAEAEAREAEAAQEEAARQAAEDAAREEEQGKQGKGRGKGRGKDG